MSIKPNPGDWHEVSKDYTSSLEPFVAGLVDEIAAILNDALLAPPMHLLEAGCGSGQLSLLLHKMGYRTTLLDFDQLAIEKAGQLFARGLGHAPDDADFVCGDLMNLDAALGRKKFDVVWNSGVLEHFSSDNLGVALRQMALHASEAVLVIVPNPASMIYLAYREKMLGLQRWNVGVEFLWSGYADVAAEAGLELIQSGYCGRDYSRHLLEFVIENPDASRWFNEVIAGGQAPEQCLYLQYLLFKPSAAPGIAKKAPKPKTRPDTLNRTFYLDALGMANGTIAHLRRNLEIEQLKTEELNDHVERLKHESASLAQNEARLLALLGEKENLLHRFNAQLLDKDALIERLDRQNAEKAGLAAEMQARAESLGQARQQFEDEVKRLVSVLGEKENLLHRFNAQLLDKDALATRLDRQNSEQANKLVALEDKLRRLELVENDYGHARAELGRLEALLREKTALADQLAESVRALQSEIEELTAKFCAQYTGVDQPMCDVFRRRNEELAQELNAQIAARTAELQEQAERHARQLKELMDKLEKTETNLRQRLAEAESEAARQSQLLVEQTRIRQRLETQLLNDMRAGSQAAEELSNTLGAYLRSPRFRIAHYINILHGNLLRGPLARRVRFVKNAVAKLAGKHHGPIAAENTLAAPMRKAAETAELLRASRLAYDEFVKSEQANPPQGRAGSGNGKLVHSVPAIVPKPTNVPAKLPRAPHGRRRVAYLTNQLFDWHDHRPRQGGGERYAIELALLLRELGLDVHFFQPAVEPFEGVYESFPVTCFPLREYYSEFHWGTCNHFTRLAAEYDHVIHNMPEYTSGMVRKDALLVCHGIWFDHDNYPSAKFRTPEWYEHLSRVFSNPRLVVSVDTNSINYIRAIWPQLAGHMRFIPNFYRAQDFFPKPEMRDKDRLTVLFPRRSQINRGSRLLEGILNRVPHDVRFCWVGEGDPEDTEMIKDLACRDKRLSFHRAEFDQMAKWYQTADITVIPTIACEGTSLSCLEALASGSAVISTNVGGLSDLVQTGNNGILVDPRADTIAEAINYLIEDDAERKRLQQVGPLSARPFEIAQWRQKWAHILAEQKWAPEEAFERIGLNPNPHRSASGDAVFSARGIDMDTQRICIITRNGIHGGVETTIAIEAEALGAKVIVAGGIDQPETCPFPYTRADNYEQLIGALHDFDVILYHWLPAWAVEAIADSGLPCVEYVHRTDTCENDKKVPTRIVAHSSFLAEFVTEEFDRDCDIVEYPINTRLYEPAPKLGECIGAVTSYYDIKGLDVFLRAWALVKDEFPGVPVRFYGQGADQAKLEALAAELGVKAEFRAPVTQPWKALPEFRLFVLPSRIEGLPLASLEALSMNLPIVASDIDGVVECNAIAGLRGFEPPFATFRSEDHEDMARVLRQTLNRSGRPNTRAYVEKHHSIENHRLKFRRILADALIEGGRGPRAMRHLATWHDESSPGNPETGMGMFMLRVGESIETVPLATPAEMRAAVYTNDFFPFMMIRLPDGVNAFEWQATADRNAIVNWQIDWFDEKYNNLGYVADSARLNRDVCHGCLTKKVPEGTRYAKVNLRPHGSNTMRLNLFKLRAFTAANH